MKTSLNLYFVTSLFLVFFLISCRSDKKPCGPSFGNGFHNGFADQHSIIIWTRLTQNPEGNSTGEAFLVPSVDEHRELNIEADSEKIRKAQIPEGFSLDNMEGACPGAPGEVRITYYPLSDQENKTTTNWTAVDTAKNFTHQWKLENLNPGTKYVVELEARNPNSSSVSDRIQGAFRTPPVAEAEEEIKFCVVTCHDFMRRDSATGHKIYDAMLKLFPDFYVHTGDIEYYDRPQPYALTEELMRFKWDRFFAMPLQRNFWAQVTSYFMKDDHDVLANDASPGKTYGTVSWDRGLAIFDEQNPADDKPYKTVRWGKDLQIWLTEGRLYRSPNNIPDGPGKTIFGKEQKEWLFKTLQESDATFKVIINANPVLGPDRENKKDNYSNATFKYEGDEIREFFNRFDNVYLCNGDRHWQYVTHFEGTNLWEFSCGAGTDIHSGGWSQEDVRPEHRFLRVKGGFLQGIVKRESGKPTLIFQHHDVNGKLVHKEIFAQEMKLEL